MPALTFIRSFIRNNYQLLFFGGWLLLNLLQAGLTELFDDEAYYWVYSRYPAWGYFDHPPMIALFIKAGFLFFKNELGVRLFIVLASTAALLIIQALLPKKNDRLFYAIAASMAVLQIGGFIAVPDIPLMLFTALFFWIYRRFIQKQDASNILLLGLIIASMLYSKYHSILIIFFTLLSNPGLLLKYQTWIVALIALVCFIPHLYWQYQNGFVSLQFHLLDRNPGNLYRLSFTWEYVWSQALLAGPFAGFILLWAGFAYRPVDLFEKALKYTLAGFYIFFLLVTLKGRVEANWTVPAFVPLMILSHQYLHARPAIAKWIFRLVPFTLVCVLALRIYFIWDIPPLGWIAKDEVHGNRQWMDAIQKKAKGLPVVFLDSYQNASRYWFYTGHPSFSLNTPYYRRNNYNFWPVEDSLLNKPVYVVGLHDPVFLKDSIISPKGFHGGMAIPHYISFSRINIKSPKRLPVADGRLNAVLHIMVCEPKEKLSLVPDPDKTELQLWINLGRRSFKIINTGICLNQLKPGDNLFAVSVPLDLPKGKYFARFAIPSAVPRKPTVNSGFIQVLSEQ